MNTFAQMGHDTFCARGQCQKFRCLFKLYGNSLENYKFLRKTYNMVRKYHKKVKKMEKNADTIHRFKISAIF